MTDGEKRGWNLKAAAFASNCKVAVFRMPCEDARSWYGCEREPEGGDSEYLVSSVHGHWRSERGMIYGTLKDGRLVVVVETGVIPLAP